MLIIVSGAVGIGKTTVCQRVIDAAKGQGHSCGGVITYKAPDGSIIIEDVQTGKNTTLASRAKAYPGPQTGRYCFSPEGIEFGIEAIDRGTGAAVLVVDEIGHLELRGEGFTNAVRLMRAGRVKNCITVIRSELLATFMPRLGELPLVFETSAANRDSLPKVIGQILSRTVPEPAMKTTVC